LAWYGDDQKTQFETGLKAWLVALATEDNHLKIMAANNLGETYTWAGEFDKGLEYLKKAYDLAKLIDDQHNLAKVSKTIGASYFFRGYFDAAIIHYKSAYAILKEGKDLDWLGDLSHDLAEAHVELGLQEETKNYHELFECGRQYYAEGMKIATDMFVDVLFANLTALNEKYYGIFHRLPKKEQPGFEQQLRARRYVEKHGQITPKRYCEINNVSRAAATRHLKEVENKGIIEQKGRGGAIYYVLKTEPDLDGYLDFVI
jgi:tetratricopeptide (TPR) repeat protein